MGRKNLTSKLLLWVRLCCKQRQGQRSSSHAFREDMVLHCTTWLQIPRWTLAYIHWGFLRLTMRANHSEPSAALGQEQSGPAAVQAAGLSSSATTGNTRSEHWMGLEYSMGWAFRTLDRAGTFYGMGIITVATPETKHKAIRREVTATLQRGLTISKVPMRYFDDPVVDLQFGLCGAAWLHCWGQKQETWRCLEGILALAFPSARLAWDDAECVRRDLSWSGYFSTHDRYGPNQHELHGFYTALQKQNQHTHTHTHKR